MKYLIFLISFVLFASCSSVSKTGHKETDALMEHMTQSPRVIGKDWEERFTQDGFINGEYVAIGVATSKDLNANYIPLKSNAESMAVGNLLKSAPSDFKKIIHRTLNTLEGNEGSTSEDQIMITEVKALTGLKSDFKDFQCVKKAIPNTNMKYDFVKECRVLVRIKSAKLLEAYDFTLNTKYGFDQKSKVEKILSSGVKANKPVSLRSVQDHITLK